MRHVRDMALQCRRLVQANVTGVQLENVSIHVVETTFS